MRPSYIYIYTDKKHLQNRDEIIKYIHTNRKHRLFGRDCMVDGLQLPVQSVTITT